MLPIHDEIDLVASLWNAATDCGACDIYGWTSLVIPREGQRVVRQGQAVASPGRLFASCGRSLGRTLGALLCTLTRGLGAGWEAVPQDCPTSPGDRP
jgi:hypothetical protein